MTSIVSFGCLPEYMGGRVPEHFFSCDRRVSETIGRVMGGVTFWVLKIKQL
jgi:hypothetical protein